MMHVNLKLFLFVTLWGFLGLLAICFVMDRVPTVLRLPLKMIPNLRQNRTRESMRAALTPLPPGPHQRSVYVRTAQENTSTLEHFRGLYKSQSGDLENLCHDINRTIVSESQPRFYPYPGTGAPANLYDDVFDTSHFREFCNTKMAAVVVVYSATENFDRRKAIRDTIGKQCELHGCKVVFIVGTSTDPGIMVSFLSEYATDRDVFVMNKVDEYRHLNDKAVAMLDWLLEYCRQPKFVIHHGDDVFSNVELYLKGMSSVTDTQRFIYGRVWHNIRPNRDANSKYVVTPGEYPYTRYPEFVNGISYGFPTSLARELRCAVHWARYIWLEDVWLCGEVASYLGLQLVDSEFRSWHRHFQKLKLSQVNSLLFIHFAKPEDLYRFNASLRH